MAVSLKLSALQNLQNQIPVANQKIAAGMKAARDIQIQQAVAKAPKGGTIAPAAQATAASAVAETGQAQVNRAKEAITQAGQIGQLRLGEQQLVGQREIAGAREAARAEEMANMDKLAKIDAAKKKEIYDDEMRFQKDESNRTVFNIRKMADYAVLNARSNIELANFKQKAEQLEQRNQKLLNVVFDKVIEDLEFQWKLAEQQKDQAAKLKITQMKVAAEKARARSKANAANNAAMISAVSGVIGAGIGMAVLPGPGGAALGYQIGTSASAIFT